MKQLFPSCYVLYRSCHKLPYRIAIDYICLLCPMPGQAQQVIKNGTGFANPNTIVEWEARFRFASVIVAPIPFSSPLIGSGLTLGAGCLFNFPGSKPSSFGVANLASSNGSTGFGGGASINFGQRKWNVFALAAQADVFYDLPVFGEVDLPINQDGELASFTVRGAVSENSVSVCSCLIWIPTAGLTVIFCLSCRQPFSLTGKLFSVRSGRISRSIQRSFWLRCHH
jgi:hypothetical protein